MTDTNATILACEAELARLERAASRLPPSTDAPGSLRFRRDMLTLCREWLLSDYDCAHHSNSGLVIELQTQHDAALRIIAALAASLGIDTGITPKETQDGNL